MLAEAYQWSRKPPRRMVFPKNMGDDGALIREFIDGYYGPAAPYIEQYVEILHASAKQHPTYLAVKTPPVSPQYLRDVKIARLPVDYAFLMNPRLKHEHGTRLARFKNHLQLTGVTAYREGRQGGDALIQALEIPRTMAKPAAECDGRAQDECIEIQDLGFNLAGDARLVADRIASDGAAARMGGRR